MNFMGKNEKMRLLVQLDNPLGDSIVHPFPLVGGTGITMRKNTEKNYEHNHCSSSEYLFTNKLKDKLYNYI